MDIPNEMNEKLREVCCLGQIDAVFELLSNGADVNAQHKMNGWTPLHWAAKRGHGSLITVLLNSGADKDIKTFKGENAYSLAVNDEIRQLLDAKTIFSENEVAEANNSSLFKPIATNSYRFVPNYLAHPEFPYTDQKNETVLRPAVETHNGLITTNHNALNHSSNNSELVLKVRNASSSEQDFIEIELVQTELTFKKLVSVCCKELQVECCDIMKVRKLPNTILRKDKDVARLCNFQEIELLMKN